VTADRPPEPGVPTTPDHRQRTAHRGALAVLGACAVVIAVSPSPLEPAEIPGTPPPLFPSIAVALGVAAITCRQLAASATRTAQTRFVLTIACFAFAAGIGIVGLALFWLEGMRRIALLYTMGGAILALRSPPPIHRGGPGAAGAGKGNGPNG